MYNNEILVEEMSCIPLSASTAFNLYASVNESPSKNKSVTCILWHSRVLRVVSGL